MLVDWYAELNSFSLATFLPVSIEWFVRNPRLGSYQMYSYSRASTQKIKRGSKQKERKKHVNGKRCRVFAENGGAPG